MNSSSTLTGPHLQTYTTLFQHPVSHNLQWRAVQSLFAHLGEMTEESNGNFKVTRNNQTMVLRPSHTKDVAEVEEIMTLRHFLQRSEPTLPVSGEAEAHWLLVVNHHEARIYRTEMEGGSPHRISSHSHDSASRHAPHSKDFSRGQEKPDPNGFFEPVSKALQSGGPILIFGTGTGKSSEMAQFVTWLKLHHPATAHRIVGSVVIDENHLSEGQLLAKARSFYSELTPKVA